MRFSSLLITIALAACASSSHESDTAVAQLADLAAAKGRLESELATTKQRAERERAARIEAQVRLAHKTYELELEKVNALVASTICDARSGALTQQAANERLDRAKADVQRLDQGCAPNEPGDQCVERKARAEAERSSP